LVTALATGISAAIAGTKSFAKSIVARAVSLSWLHFTFLWTVQAMWLVLEASWLSKWSRMRTLSFVPSKCRQRKEKGQDGCSKGREIHAHIGACCNN